MVVPSQDSKKAKKHVAKKTGIHGLGSLKTSSPSKKTGVQRLHITQQYRSLQEKKTGFTMFGSNNRVTKPVTSKKSDAKKAHDAKSGVIKTLADYHSEPEKRERKSSDEDDEEDIDFTPSDPDDLMRIGLVTRM